MIEKKQTDTTQPVIKKVESFHKKDLPLEEIIEKVPENNFRL